MSIVPLYASILALLFMVLSIRTVQMRRRFKIGIGDAGNNAMLRAMRVHSNFAEYVPLSLLLIFFVEMAGASLLLVHGLAWCLLLGRASHAFGVSQIRENYRFRVFGITMTFAVLIAASLYLLYSYASKAVA